MKRRAGLLRFVWFGGLGVIVALMLGLGSALALVSVAPFRPGDALYYAVQQPLEKTLVVLDRRPSGQARRLLDLAQRRADDLAMLAGSPHETEAVAELEHSLVQAVQAAGAARQPDAAVLRPQLMRLLQSVEQILPRVKPPAGQYSEQWAAFQAWESGVARKALNPNLVLASLVPGAEPQALTAATAAPVPTPTLEPTPTPAVVAARIVWFQPGSPGALHEFFPLTGAHGPLDCAACHPTGDYAGTATGCLDCHSAQLPAGHYPGGCTTCHDTTAWKPAHFDHALNNAADCQVCHLRDKPAGHYPGQCSACHTTGAWQPVHFDHAVAGATDCLSCHAAPANHYRGQCSACHTTAAWKPAHFNHEAAGATDCQSCHQRPANHFGGQCSACHGTSGWTPASFNHAAAGATDCQSCHARPANHFPGQCSDCHTTSTWSGASFNHTFPINHRGANGECAKCHPSGTNSWTCASCHDPGQMDQKHREIPSYTGNCIQCHAGGEKGDD